MAEYRKPSQRYLSGRVKIAGTEALASDRHLYVEPGQVEPNLGFVGEKSIPISNQYYQLVTIENGGVYDRYWQAQSGLEPGGVTIFDEGIQVGLANSITKLNFVGSGVTANASGSISTITVSTSARVAIGENPPSGPQPGDLWWESDTAKLKVYYDDGNTAQWVDASPAGGGGASNVSGLSDVSLTSPQDGDILRYNAGTSEWVNTANNVSTLNTAYFGVGDPGTGTPSIVQIEGLGAGGALELSNGGSPVAISFDFNTGTAGQVITATGNDGFGNATGATWSDAPAPSASVYFNISGGTGTGYILDGGGFSNTASNPTIYVYRGFTYSFNNTTGSSHPFALRQTSGGTAVSGVTGSQTGEQFWTVPMSLAAGTTYVYQCTIHSAMVGNIVVV